MILLEMITRRMI